MPSIPKKKQKRRVPRARNNPKPTGDDWCIICGKPYAQTHEVFRGKNRQISIKHGFQVKLCDKHHKETDNNKELAESLKKNAQQIYEIKHTREEFMKLIGRNYIL